MRKHATTMTHSQRSLLASALPWLVASVVAEMTDAELYEQWLYTCGYPGGVDHVKDALSEGLTQ